MTKKQIRYAIAAAWLAALVVPANARSPRPDQEQQISVELSSFKFTPSVLILRHGAPSRLHLTNTSSGGHNFVAKEFFAASTIAPEDQAKVQNGAVDVKSGESVDIRLVANTPGAYKLHCSHFMHSSFGMTGTITVE